MVPIEFLVTSLQIAVKEQWDRDLLPPRLENLERLMAFMVLAFQAHLVEKANRKAWHDNKVKDKDMVESEMVLKIHVPAT